jgi:hypothetical protein
MPADASRVGVRDETRRPTIERDERPRCEKSGTNEREAGVLSEGMGTNEREGWAHDMRAFFISSGMFAGRDALWITDRTGHTTLGVLRTYERDVRRFAVATRIPTKSRTR